MRALQAILLTGGAGFIGSALARQLLGLEGFQRLVVLDKLTTGGPPRNLAGLEADPRFLFVEGDIADRLLVAHLITTHGLTGVMNLAAAVPADSTVAAPESIVATNVLGTAQLLEVCRLTGTPMLQCSSGEVYGPVEAPGKAGEEAPCNPFSPLAASKAAADMMCLASHRSYGQDVVITRATYTYGPRQPAGELIPMVVRHAIRDQAVPLPGQGMQIRDWIHVDDHCRAMITAFQRGAPGGIFNFSGGCERTNLGVARNILQILGKPVSLIVPGADGPGEDPRCALDTGKALRYFGWQPEIPIQKALGNLARELAANLIAEAPRS